MLKKKNMRDDRWRNEMRVEEIKTAIEALPGAKFVEIRKWVAERDWKMWDQEVEADLKAGRLDFLVEEAFHEKHQGRLRKL